MRSKYLLQVDEGIADAAFDMDSSGLISSWNVAAKELFGLSSEEAIGRPCHEILQCADESGVVCFEHCSIQQALHTGSPITNFDLQVQTKAGPQWCNISVLTVTKPRSEVRYAVHIVRPREMRKRLEQLLRDFVADEAKLKREVAAPAISPRPTNATDINLTPREKEILRLLAAGKRTKAIADQLPISPVTVNNHIRHILTKLGAHTRLEAVRRAERAGLI
jgi:PAS domain S-box-containing protein